VALNAYVMRKFIIIELLLTIYTITACFESQSELYQKIITIDSLSRYNQRDSAVMIFRTIDITNAPKKEKSYYNILSIRLSEVNSSNYDSLLNALEFFYHKSSEKSKLAEVYLDKCNYYLYDKEIYDSVKYFYTKAESLALEISDYYLLSRINWIKNHYHCYERNTYEAKKDVDLQLFYAEKSKNQRQIAYATLNKAAIYMDINMNDSAEICLHAALLLSNNINKSDKALIYNALGEINLKNDTILAKENLKKSLEIFSNDAAKLNLAKLYLSQNNLPEVESLCQEGINCGWSETKIDFLKLLYLCKTKKNDMTSAIKIQNDIISEKDSIIELLKTKNQELALLQVKKITNEKQEKNDKILGISITFCIAILLTSLLIIKYRKERKKHEKSISEKDAEIVALKEMFNSEKDKNKNIIKKGEKLYSQIMKNLQISSWTTDDMVNFIEYYRTIKPDFVDNLENNYKKLTPRYKIILILEDLGKNLEEIKKVMSFEESSYYSAKSRINSQKKQ